MEARKAGVGRLPAFGFWGWLLAVGFWRLALPLRGSDDFHSHLFPRRAGGVGCQWRSGGFPAKIAAGDHDGGIVGMGGWGALSAGWACDSQDAQGGAFVRGSVVWLAADVCGWLIGRLRFQFQAQVLTGDSVKLFDDMTLGDGMLESKGAGFDRGTDDRIFALVTDAESSAVGDVDEDGRGGGMGVHGGPLVGAIVHAHDADEGVFEFQSGVAGDDLRGEGGGEDEEEANLAHSVLFSQVEKGERFSWSRCGLPSACMALW